MCQSVAFTTQAMPDLDRVRIASLRTRCTCCSVARTIVSVVGLVVRISAFHADGPGSIPGQRTFTKVLRL